MVTSCSHTASNDSAARLSYYRDRASGQASYPAYARLGLASLQRYRETGDEAYYREALSSLQKSLGYQRNFEALLGMGLALSERHRFTNALPYIREALDAMPGNAQALAGVFDIQLALGRERAASDALDALRRGMAAARQETGTARDLAEWRFLCATRGAALAEYGGSYGAAAVDMDAAAQASDAAPMPAFTRAWCRVRAGSLQLLAGNAAAAKDRYDEALRIAPGHFPAREHIAEWRAARGEWSAAEALYRQLQKERPEPACRIALAETLERQGRASESRRELSRAEKELREANAGGALDHCRDLAALLLGENRDPAQALALARQDWAMRQDIFAADTLAWALSANGESAEALKLSAQALAVNTNHAGLLLHGAIVRLRAGGGSEAEPLLARARENPAAFTTAERKALAQAEALLPSRRASVRASP